MPMTSSGVSTSRPTASPGTGKPWLTIEISWLAPYLSWLSTYPSLRLACDAELSATGGWYPDSCPSPTCSGSRKDGIAPSPPTTTTYSSGFTARYASTISLIAEATMFLA